MMPTDDKTDGLFCFSLLSKIVENAIFIYRNIKKAVFDMTQEEIKKLDKKIRLVQDPFGTGFRTVYKIYQEASTSVGIPLSDMIRQYVAWKMKT